MLVKKGDDKAFTEFLKTEATRDYTKLAKDQEEFVKKATPLFVKPAQEDEDGNPGEEVPAVCYVHDMLRDNRVFSWGGIGFGDQESYRL